MSELIYCECGCGEQIPARDKKNRPRRFVPGHHNRLKPKQDLPEHLEQYKFKKGQEPWNKGKHPEYCQGKNSYFATHKFDNGKKISEALKGRIPKNVDILLEKGKEHRFTSDGISGERNYNWKGGVTPINARARSNKKYFNWRNAIFQRDNWTCQKCNVRGGDLEAHHIKPFATYKELRYDIDNGITYCVECHKLLDTQRR